MKGILSPELIARTRQFSDEALVLALEAYREGRHQGAATACADLEGFARAQIAELRIDGTLTEPERQASIEALERMRVELGRIARRALCAQDERPADQGSST